MRNKYFLGFIAGCLLALPAIGNDITPTQIKTALAHPDRPAEDKARDATRKPVEVLSFFGLRSDMQVGDMMAGGGYYTEIISRSLDDSGKVYAQNNSIALGKFADKAISKRLAGNRLPNVVRLDKELENPGFPKGGLDMVMMVLFYHDSYWMKADRAAMNKAVHDSLKPGGVFAVIDHHAQPGTGARDVKSLHRVEASLVKKEILAAGFVLEAESDLLRNKSDDRLTNVFKELRGQTDRFIFKFVKPAKK